MAPFDGVQNSQLHGDPKTIDPTVAQGWLDDSVPTPSPVTPQRDVFSAMLNKNQEEERGTPIKITRIPPKEVSAPNPIQIEALVEKQVQERMEKMLPDIIAKTVTQVLAAQQTPKAEPNAAKLEPEPKEITSIVDTHPSPEPSPVTVSETTPPIPDAMTSDPVVFEPVPITEEPAAPSEAAPAPAAPAQAAVPAAQETPKSSSDVSQFLEHPLMLKDAGFSSPWDHYRVLDVDAAKTPPILKYSQTNAAVNSTPSEMSVPDFISFLKQKKFTLNPSFTPSAETPRAPQEFGIADKPIPPARRSWFVDKKFGFNPSAKVEPAKETSVPATAPEQQAGAPTPEASPDGSKTQLIKEAAEREQTLIAAERTALAQRIKQGLDRGSPVAAVDTLGGPVDPKMESLASELLQSTTLTEAMPPALEPIETAAVPTPSVPAAIEMPSTPATPQPETIAPVPQAPAAPFLFPASADLTPRGIWGSADSVLEPNEAFKTLPIWGKDYVVDAIVKAYAAAKGTTVESLNTLPPGSKVDFGVLDGSVVSRAITEAQSLDEAARRSVMATRARNEMTAYRLQQQAAK